MSEPDRQQLERRVDRERRARKHAEALIEEKSLQLYRANQELAVAHEREQAHRLRVEAFNEELEQRVAAATEELRAQHSLLERRVRELAALNGVAISLSSLMSLDRLLERIIALSTKLMHAEAASLLILDRQTGKLTFRVARGSASAALKPLTVELGQGIAGTVAQSGMPLLIPDVSVDPRFDASFDAATGFRTESILAVPVKTKDETIGVIEVINRIDGARFGEEDISLFESFAAIAGAAWENARLFEETKAMAEDLKKALEQERRLSIEKEKMGAYIPKHVVDDISRNREQKLALGGKTVLASVLFADLKGFTTLCETMPPQSVIGLLNIHMTAMAEIIEDEGGVLDKFIGDGIMAVFTSTGDDDNHARRAVRAGCRMQRKLAELRDARLSERPEMQGLEMRVGINTGEVVAGNIGSETRMDYTVVGDVVNVASRIEGSCEPGAVFISDASFEFAAGAFTSQRIEPIQVKNRVQPIQMHSIGFEREESAPG